jgi:hypothetical protein
MISIINITIISASSSSPYPPASTRPHQEMHEALDQQRGRVEAQWLQSYASRAPPAQPGSRRAHLTDPTDRQLLAAQPSSIRSQQAKVGGQLLVTDQGAQPPSPPPPRVSSVSMAECRPTFMGASPWLPEPACPWISHHSRQRAHH